MSDQAHRYKFKRIFFAIILTSVVLTLTGCGYFSFYTRKAHWRQTFAYMPSVSALNKLAPEESLVLTGKIIKPQQGREPLLLVAVSNRYRKNEKVAIVQLGTDTRYIAFLPNGDYELLIFSDLDKNEDFEWNEVIGRTLVTVSSEQSKDGAIVEGPPITLDFEHPGNVDFHISETVRPSGYVYASLDNEFFDPTYGKTGLYNPSELIAHNQGFFFGLEDYDEEKTTVLFVHGISGTPRDWKYIVQGLDRSRFQPFFFYYPSGLPLDKIGTLLSQLIESIDRTATKRGRRIVLVAHSMGGLVAVSSINKLVEGKFPSSLKMYCSLSTPYGGDASARKGVEIAPVVVPVWRDIAVDSAFLKNLTSKPFPKQLPYYLFFSYLDTSKLSLGERSDGSVTLRSQLAPTLQAAATKVLGFNETHDGILNSAAARDSLLHLLDTISPHPPRTGTKEPQE